jgi:hypothetical protein
MSIISKWILKKAEAIKKKQEAEEAAKKAAELTEQQEYRSQLRSLRDYLENVIKEYAKAKESEPCHIKTGDRVVLNIYSLGEVDPINGWDGGPLAMSKYLKEPTTMIITDVYVDTSYAFELIDRFFNNNAFVHKNGNLFLVRGTMVRNRYRETEQLIGTMNAWQIFYEWMKRRKDMFGGISAGDSTGLYKTARFDYDGDFKPSWGLNVYSFLKEGTPEFDETLRVWSREVAIEAEMKRLAEESQKLQQEKREISKKYKGITYS